MDAKLILVTLLHDVGKILQRAGERPRCVLEGDFHEHDRLTCDFLQDYLGEEYVKIFKEGKWRVADYASASERIGTEAGPQQPFTTPLLDPVLDVSPNDLDKLRDKEVWYPVTYIDFNARPESYGTRKMSEAFVSYKKIEEVLKSLAEKAKKIKDPLSLLETYDYIYRTVALLVPAAVYQAVPNTTLYGHSRLAAPLSVCQKVRLLLIDVKGIQRFLTNVKGEAETSKRLRGRSFFLQLLQRALTDKLAEVLGLTSLHNISFEPGKLIFVACGLDEKKVKDVEKVLTDLEEWSAYELQFAYSLSGEIEVAKMKIYSENEEDRDFQRALDEAFKNLRTVGRPSVTKDVKVDYFGDLSPRYYEVDKVEGIETLTAGEVTPRAETGRPQYISEMNLISLIVGHSTRNLDYVIEVVYKDGARGENAYRDNVGEIYIEPLNVGFLLVHNVRGDESRKGTTGNRKDVAFLKSLIQTKKDVAKRIRVFAVNDTTNFVLEELAEEGVSFGYITLSTYHPVDEGGRFKSLDELGNYLALGVTDGDRIGEIAKRLSAFPGRFMTFSTLLDFAFAHVVVREVTDRTGQGAPVVILYSGGDDLAVYGKWDEAFELLVRLSKLVRRVIPSISVSGGVFVFKKKYPIAYAYSFAREYEALAKAERTGSGGRVASNIFEKYREGSKELTSLSWEEAEEFLTVAKNIGDKVPSAYLYKLYQIGSMVEAGEDHRALVSYAYLNARNEKYAEEMKGIYKKFLTYPGDDAEKVLSFLLKFRTAVNMYSLLKRE
ncbi:MAG: Cas10/Cmr2 second palm domain-containing protein [Thermoprotei archaeon]